MNLKKVSDSLVGLFLGITVTYILRIPAQEGWGMAAAFIIYICATVSLLGELEKLDTSSAGTKKESTRRANGDDEAGEVTIAAIIAIIATGISHVMANQPGVALVVPVCLIFFACRTIALELRSGYSKAKRGIE